MAASAAGALALTGVVLTSSPATATETCEQRANNTVEKLLHCVKVSGVTEHLDALQGIADANGGNRASGTPGYTASADYVAGKAEAAGYTVTRQSFEFPFFSVDAESFRQAGPAPTDYVAGTDFTTMTFSGSGTVAGAVVTPVDIGAAAPTSTSTSGCEAEDFAGFPAGSVALMQRGTCGFGDKVANAAAAGASAAIIFNRGEGEDGVEVFTGTLGAPGAIPAIGTSFAVGAGLSGATVDLSVTTTSGTRTTENVLAELPGAKTTDNVVMAGAHLDSVVEGPGINDNGTGTAAILEVAEMMAKAKPTNTVRFAWWGAEELGLLGSTHYVETLTDEQRGAIGLYLNFDMVGSPNFVRFVYDGDQSTFPAPEGFVVPPGSAEIEDVFQEYYDARGLAYEDSEFNGRSDYEAFALAGIPAGGLFTGAEGLKTEEQAARYGGTAGQAYDACYHLACDTITNIDREVLDQNADAIAYATLTLAYSTELVNGVPGRPAPGPHGAGGHAHDAAA